MQARVGAVALCLLTSIVIGCGSDDATPGLLGPPGEILEFDAGQINADASGGTGATGGSGGSAATGGGATGGTGASGGSAGSAGVAGGGGSGGGAPGYATNTPGAQVVQDNQGQGTDLEIISSNLSDEISGTEYYQAWVGLMQNKGLTTVCYPQVTATFEDSSGSIVAGFLAFAKTAPYKLSSSTLSASCLAPGEIGGVFSNDFASSALKLDQIERVVFKFSATSGAGAVLHPSAPIVSGVSLYERFGAGTGYWAAQGTLKGGSSSIHNISIRAYPVSSNGLVPDELSDTKLDALLAGSSYMFNTTTYQGAPASGPIHVSIGFIEGAFKILPPQPDSIPDDQIFALARSAKSVEENAKAQALLDARVEQRRASK